MRFLIWQEREPNAQGGAESWVSDTCRALKACGHEAAWLYSPFMDSAINSYRPDAIILGTMQNYIGLRHAEHLADKHPNVPAIWFLHDYWPWCKPRMLMRDLNRSDQQCPACEKLCDNSCGGHQAVPEVLHRFALATGSFGAAQIMRRHGLKIAHIIEEGIDTDLFKPADGPRDWSAIYASAAWNAPWKGMHTLQAAAAMAGVEVRLLTGMKREDIARVLSTAGMFAMPSLYEEIWGLACTEAMASGCAFVGTNVAGICAQVHQGIGHFVKTHDIEGLRDTIADMAKRREDAEQMGKRAREHVAEHHSLTAVGRRWEAAFACAS